jgi:hypothetical protein
MPSKAGVARAPHRTEKARRVDLRGSRPAAPHYGWLGTILVLALVTACRPPLQARTRCEDKPATMRVFSEQMAEGSGHWLRCAETMDAGECEDAHGYDMIKLSAWRDSYAKSACVDHNGKVWDNDPAD